MNIAIDATMLTPQSGGILRYGLNLLPALNQFRGPDRYFIFCQKSFAAIYPEIAALPDIVPIEWPHRIPYSRQMLGPLKWNGWLKRIDADLFHSLISYQPTGIRVPTVITVHDLRALELRHNYHWYRQLFLRRQIRHSIQNAAGIIAVSDFTRNHILKNQLLPAAQVLTVHHGFEATPFQIPPLASVKKDIISKYNLPPKFILSVGHLEPRKNYERLLLAFRMLRQSGNSEHKLVIVGQANHKNHSIFKTLKELNLEEPVIFTGFVPETHLAALYHLSDLFVLPSCYEGFGFPPLESMAANTPVVCSNATSLPEICGDGAIYFNPLSVEDIYTKIEFVLNNDHIRHALQQKGQHRLNTFSWEKCAEKTAQAYRTFSKGTL